MKISIDDIKKFLLDHFEKIVLAGLFVFLIVQIILLCMTSDIEALNKEMQGKIKEVEKKLKAPMPHKEEKLDYKDMTRRPYEDVLKGSILTPWTMFVEQKIEIKKKVIQPEKITIYEHRPPINVKITNRDEKNLDKAKDIGKIKLSWDFNTKDREEDNKTYKAVAPTELKIFKKEGDGKFEEIKGVRLKGDERTYEDSDVKAKTKYSYRICSISNDKRIKPKDKEKKSEPTKPVTQPSDYEISFINHHGQKMGFFEIKRWHNGKWISEKTGGIKIGQEITAYTKIGREQVKLTPGYKLLKIIKEEKEVEVGGTKVIKEIYKAKIQNLKDQKDILILELSQ